MARGGRRQGSPGKSYSNRSDLNVDRAMAPGASGTMPPVTAGPPQPGTEDTGMPMLTPDDTPNLTDPTTTPESLSESLMAAEVPPAAMSPSQMLLFAAMQADPNNQTLRRIRNNMQALGEM